MGFGLRQRTMHRHLKDYLEQYASSFTETPSADHLYQAGLVIYAEHGFSRVQFEPPRFVTAENFPALLEKARSRELKSPLG
jgi:DNA-binding transcriptional ArsR family regulator